MAELPSGTVTFLFSDVEGSTQLLERHGAAMGGALARHHELFEQTVERHGGSIFETVGDAVYAAFGEAGAAVAAALDAQRALAAEDWGLIGMVAVRIALHTGAVERRGDHYFGPALFRVARLQALGYGEQTLLSSVTAGLASEAMPAAASLRDLGSHRLKDLGEPEHVNQLVHPDLRADFPALKSLDAHPHNLPVQLSSFVGRETEVAEVGLLLGQHRLVTMLGPGGIGKTRLALQVAADALDRFADGVFFVDLASLRDPELVPGAIAAALGLREQPGQPISASLAEHLTTRQLLLVLDNLEQLLPAAAVSVAELLGSAAELRLLATSRAPLRIRGEHEYGVAPLAIGAPDRLDDEVPAAVALFLERARAIKPELEINATTVPLMAGICLRLDGLPLAIELAAARLRALGLPQLHERLAQRLPLLTGGARDLPERQQTLRAAIAWSEELLSERERRLFAALGVFVGGFTLEAAEAVAGPDIGTDVLDGVTSLLERSLLRQVEGLADEPRYGMLETIREYAVERLEASGEPEELRGRHLNFYIARAEEWNAAIIEDDPHGVAAFRAEAGNLAEARRYADAVNQLDASARLVAASIYLWELEGASLLDHAWAQTVANRYADVSPGVRADLIRSAGTTASIHGHYDDAWRWAQLNVDLARSAGDPRLLAWALTDLAGTGDRGREARQDFAIWLDEALALAREHDDQRLQLRILTNTGWEAAFRSADLDEGRRLLTEAAGLAARQGRSGAHIHFLLAAIAAIAGDADEAERRSRDALERARRVGDRRLERWTRLYLAEAARLRDEFAEAALRVGAVFREWADIPDVSGLVDATCSLAYIASQAGAHAQATVLLVHLAELRERSEMVEFWWHRRDRLLIEAEAQRALGTKEMAAIRKRERPDAGSPEALAAAVERAVQTVVGERA